MFAPPPRRIVCWDRVYRHGFALDAKLVADGDCLCRFRRENDARCHCGNRVRQRSEERQNFKLDEVAERVCGGACVGNVDDRSSDDAPMRSTVNAVGAPVSLTHPTSLPVPPMSPLSSRLPLPEADVSRELPEVGTAPNVMDAILCPLRSPSPTPSAPGTL